MCNNFVIVNNRNKKGDKTDEIIFDYWEEKEEKYSKQRNQKELNLIVKSQIF